MVRFSYSQTNAYFLAKFLLYRVYIYSCLSNKYRLSLDMAYRRISLSRALELEALALIKIYYPVNTYPGLHPHSSLWYDNFKELSYKYKKVAVGSLMDFIGVEYMIDVLVQEDLVNQKYSWTYLYAQDVASLQDRERQQERGQFVYILTNNSYPHLVKIGKAVNPLSRVEQINGAGVKSEWVLRYSQPVTNDYKVEGMIHKHFQHRRITSDQGHSREFFDLSLDEAVEVLQFIAKDFFAGEGTYH